MSKKKHEEQPAEPTINPRNEQLKTQQAFLANRGFYNGEIDGDWGPQSRDAMMGFAHRNDHGNMDGSPFGSDTVLDDSYFVRDGFVYEVENGDPADEVPPPPELTEEEKRQQENDAAEAARVLNEETERKAREAADALSIASQRAPSNADLIAGGVPDSRQKPGKVKSGEGFDVSGEGNTKKPTGN